MAIESQVRLSHAPAAAKRMAGAAARFLESLSTDQRAAATFEFEGDERYVWNYTPVPRNGLRMKEMTPQQREAAMAFMATGLSDRGNETARRIIDLETTLAEWEEKQDNVSRWDRDLELYWFSVFGEPGGAKPWGWRVGGHHLCLHYTIVDGELVSPNPLFFGANPAEVRHGELKGRRTLREEEDLARALLASLDGGQKGVAVVDSTAPADILTASYRSAERDAAPSGLAYSAMGADSREVLVRLIKHYLDRSSPDLAANGWQKIEGAGLDGVTFAWAGPDERWQGHYYAVKSDGFLIEYDNTQNGANHIHSVFRDFDNDWGEDLLAAHYGGSDHHQARSQAGGAGG